MHVWVCMCLDMYGNIYHFYTFFLIIKSNQEEKRRKLTKVFIKEGQGSQIAGQAEELGHHHEPVPGPDGQCHHQQLCQDQSCERDGHHVHKLRLEEHQRAIHEDAPWWRQTEGVSFIQQCGLR